jgi:hypothetical protein
MEQFKQVTHSSALEIINPGLWFAGLLANIGLSKPKEAHKTINR